MIQIIEKAPHRDESPFIGSCNLYPTYMVKDGREYFMFNRREPDDRWRLEANETRKTFLIANDGAYFKFNGFYDDPMAMLAEVARRKHHFTDPENMYYCSIEECGYIDFHGNRREVSAAFHYRIYDPVLAARVQRAVERINREDWENWDREEESVA